MIIGITGGSGTGKSTLGMLFAQRGALFIDADAVYHRLLRENPELRSALIHRFGTDILGDDGGVDRARLGKKVFSEPAALADLNSVTHGFVVREINDMISSSSAPHIVIDAIGLFESGADKLCDVTVAVTAPLVVRLERITERDGITKERAGARIDAQKEDGYYTSRCDYTVENGGAPGDFEARAQKLIDHILENDQREAGK